MIILPAIDLLDGNCVRLVKGEYNTALKVAVDPVETAKAFEESGAEYIHVVDLNGAKEGKPINDEVIKKIKNNVKVPIEVGGGIRNLSTIEYYIENKTDRVILGSVALHDPALVKEAVKRFGNRITVGIDAKNRKASVSGWIDDSDIDFIALAKTMCSSEIGVKNIIYTDISKDGTLEGINFAHYQELKNELDNNVNITASGGVKDINDIKNLKELDIYGVICGKAIYAGTLDLRETVKFLKN